MKNGVPMKVQEMPEGRLARLEAKVRALEAAARPNPFPPTLAAPGRLADLDEALVALGGSVLPPPSPKQRYHDRSTVIICPTRGQVDTRVIESWGAMIHAMNQHRAGPIFARGYEVGEAYNALIANVLEHPKLRKWKYVLSIEDDNIPPPDAHIRLLEAMEAHPEFDGIAGLYHTKDPAQVPMAYGDPEHFKKTGRTLHFPIDRALLDPNGGPVEVLGIPMGCTLWKMELFHQIPPPWFQTLSDKILVNGQLVDHDKITEEQAADAKRCMTQDLLFCEVAVKQYGKRFAVHPGIRVGHLNVEEGVVY